MSSIEIAGRCGAILACAQEGCKIETRRVLYLGNRQGSLLVQLESRLAEAGCGYLLVGATDINEAWRLLSSARYDAILLEGGADRSEDCLNCHALHRRWLVPIMVLELSADNSQRVNLYRAGADACLAITADTSELIARLEGLFRRETWNTERGDLIRQRSSPATA
jgi:DNA-binding response OmpR family regulator